MAAQEWIAQIAAGDREAFRAVYEKYGKTVYQRALAQTGDKEQAQAVLKNVFRTLFRQLKDSDSDPLLFLLEGLTDLETGVSSGEAAAKTEASAPKADAAPAAAPAPQPETDISEAAPAEPASQPAQPQEDAVSMFDRAESELRGEYEATPLSTDQLKHLADAPTFAAKEDPEENDDDEEDLPKPHRGLTAFLIILLVVLILITLWFGAGVLMMYSIIPKIDLGYSWFNQNLFNLFRF